LSLLDPILSHFKNLYLYFLPIDTNFIKAYGIFVKMVLLKRFEGSEGFEDAFISFLSQLNNYVRCVAAK